MRHHDAEKLLGGYAAGILTEQEKQRLYAAALEHQELFDALADEEALREVLADPESRRHLQAILGEPGDKHPIKLWRRPVMFSLAASFFAMVTTSIVLWQRDRPVLATPEARHLAEVPKPTSIAKAKEGTATEIPEAKRNIHESSQQATSPMAGTPGASPAPAVQQPTALPAVAGFSVSEQQMLKADAAPDRSVEKKKPSVDKTQANAVVEVIAATSAMDKREASSQLSISKENLESLPSNRALAGSMSLTPGIAAGAKQPYKAMASSSQTHANPPEPTYTLGRIENENMRLTVMWAPGNHLYVLKRTGSQIFLLKARTSTTDKAGTTVDTFEFPLDAKDHVDLYLLPRPAPDPKILPAEGVVQGYRKRVF